MSEHDPRLDDYLSEEIPLGELPEALRQEEERLREVLATLKVDERAPAALRAAIMRDVARMPRSPWRRLAQWWLRPRTIRISPAVGTVVLAAAAVTILLWPSPPREPPSLVGAESPVPTRFVLVAPEASSVRVTGDFASWSPEGIALEDLRGTGVWTADVPLPPGVYQYTFIVNGTEWRADPTALSQVDDGFGQVNSVVIVSAESEV
jgi:hypothetical protein